jgi:hypothetical protein
MQPDQHRTSSAEKQLINRTKQNIKIKKHGSRQFDKRTKHGSNKQIGTIPSPSNLRLRLPGLTITDLPLSFLTQQL